ncbi:MAG: hypothetical protein IOD12_06405, partial [Silvanigrellales bacterium]|nr:hypothetical protein [Silvanigrellales bacterium]
CRAQTSGLVSWGVTARMRLPSPSVLAPFLLTLPLFWVSSAQGSDGPLGASLGAFVGADGEQRSQGPSPGRAHLLAPIRRLGLRPVTSNVAEFRSYLSKETSGGHAPGGFAALPLTQAQTSDRLLEMLEHALETSGRYFHVSSAASSNGDGSGVLSRPRLGAGAAAGAEDLSESEKQLEVEYDLDAWLQANVSFTPEQVRVRLTLQKALVVLAREDMLVRPDASEKDIHEAFLVALGRVSSTIGHDGRVTSLRDELVTLDFGKERGLTAGSRVELGLVVLAASHPASGETLRSRKVTTHVVEVLDAREGSSIARIVRFHPLVVRKAASLFSGGHADELPLLAWRQVPPPVLNTRGSDPWDKPREVEIEPLTGAAAQGFPEGGARASRRAGPALNQSSGDEQDAGFLGALFGSDSRASANASGVDTQTAESRPQNQSAESGSGARDSVEEGLEAEDLNAPSPERPVPRRRVSQDSQDGVSLLSARAGLGMTFGILETDRGDRYSDFPATVLNTVRAQIHLALPSEWESKPELTLRLFSGGDVEGTQFALAAPLVRPFSDSKEGRFLAGGELHVGGGSVKTIRVKQSLSHLALLGVAEYEAHLGGFGEAEVGAGVSLFGLRGGHLEGFMKVQVSPTSFLPKPLSLHARIESGPEKWTALEFGATWAFHQARGH